MARHRSPLPRHRGHYRGLYARESPSLPIASWSAHPVPQEQGQWTVAKTICAYSSRDGTKAGRYALIKAAQSALQAVANALVWDPVGFDATIPVPFP